MIAEVIKAHEAGKKKTGKTKGKKGKKGKAGNEETNSILKELKNALRPVSGERRGEEGSRPSTPMRSAHDQLMESIRGSSMRNLRRVREVDGFSTPNLLLITIIHIKSCIGLKLHKVKECIGLQRGKSSKFTTQAETQAGKQSS